MVSIGRVRLEWRQGRFLVEFFTHCDHPWLRELITEFEALAGLSWSVFERRSRGRAEVDRRIGIALDVIQKSFTRRIEAKVRPSTVRQHLFTEAVACVSRTEAVLRVARALELQVSEVEDVMFADLPGERRIVIPEPPLDPGKVAALCNREVVAAVLSRAERVVIWSDGQARTLVRHCHLREIPFTVSLDPGRFGMRLCIEGPRTVVRGARRRAGTIAELLGFLPWCRRYRLEADCVHDGRRGRFALASGDPILPGAEPRRYDSRVEEWFARDFVRATSAWELVREPAAVATDGRLAFPDFAARRRADGAERWIEIIGYWREDYLRLKEKWLEVEGVILCVDRVLAFGPESRDGAASGAVASGAVAGVALASGAVVIRYDKRIDVREVIRWL